MKLDLILAIVGIALTWIGCLVIFLKKALAKKVFMATTAVLAVLLGAAVEAWIKGGDQSVSPSFIEATRVKACLKEATLFELLTVYVHPEEFTAKYQKMLPNYWVPAEEGGQDIRSVTAAVSNLLNHGWRYSTNAELKEFEFLSIHIDGDLAHAETRQIWILPIIDREGLLLPNRAFEHYWPRINYDLEKINGRWLILKSDGPYISPDKSK